MRKRTSILSLLFAKKTGVGQTADGTKNSGQNYRMHKVLRFFLQTAALTRVVLRHHLLGSWSLGRLQIATLYVSLSKISYNSYETIIFASNNLWVLTQDIYKEYLVNFPFKKLFLLTVIRSTH